MADGTKIEWTEATWSPVTGCSIKSTGCQNCYAMKLAGTRLRYHQSRIGLTKMAKTGPVWTGDVRFNEQWLDQPLKWTRPRDIFVVAHGDLFYDKVPLAWIDQVFAVMALSQQHRFQVLTKRVDRAAAYLAMEGTPDRINAAMDKIALPHWHDRELEDHGWPLRNVLIGASVEDQTRADERRPSLASIAALGWRTWVSYEPALGPVDWAGWEFAKWFVSGGESGIGARPAHPEWHRTTRDFCAANDTPYFFKQHGAWAHKPEWAHFKELAKEPWQRTASQIEGVRPALMFNVGKKLAGALLDGREWKQMPDPRA